MEKEKHSCSVPASAEDGPRCVPAHIPDEHKLTVREQENSVPINTQAVSAATSAFAPVLLNPAEMSISFASTEFVCGVGCGVVKSVYEGSGRNRTRNYNNSTDTTDNSSSSSISIGSSGNARCAHFSSTQNNASRSGGVTMRYKLPVVGGSDGAHVGTSRGVVLPAPPRASMASSAPFHTLDNVHSNNNICSSGVATGSSSTSGNICGVGKNVASKANVREIIHCTTNSNNIIHSIISDAHAHVAYTTASASRNDGPEKNKSMNSSAKKITCNRNSIASKSSGSCTGTLDKKVRDMAHANGHVSNTNVSEAVAPLLHSSDNNNGSSRTVANFHVLHTQPVLPSLPQSNTFARRSTTREHYSAAAPALSVATAERCSVEVRQYMRAHRIPYTINSLYRSVVTVKPQEPVPYIVAQLQSNAATSSASVTVRNKACDDSVAQQEGHVALTNTRNTNNAATTNSNAIDNNNSNDCTKTSTCERVAVVFQANPHASEASKTDRLELVMTTDAAAINQGSVCSCDETLAPIAADRADAENKDACTCDMPKYAADVSRDSTTVKEYAAEDTRPQQVESVNEKERIQDVTCAMSRCCSASVVPHSLPHETAQVQPPTDAGADSRFARSVVVTATNSLVEPVSSSAAFLSELHPAAQNAHGDGDDSRNITAPLNICVASIAVRDDIPSTNAASDHGSGGSDKQSDDADREGLRASTRTTPSQGRGTGDVLSAVLPASSAGLSLLSSAIQNTMFDTVASTTAAATDDAIGAFCNQRSNTSYVSNHVSSLSDLLLRNDRDGVNLHKVGTDSADRDDARELTRRHNETREDVQRDTGSGSSANDTIYNNSNDNDDNTNEDEYTDTTCSYFSARHPSMTGDTCLNTATTTASTLSCPSHSALGMTWLEHDEATSPNELTNMYVEGSVSSVTSVDVEEFVHEFVTLKNEVVGVSSPTITAMDLGHMIEAACFPIPQTSLLFDLFNELTHSVSAATSTKAPSATTSSAHVKHTSAASSACAQKRISSYNGNRTSSSNNNHSSTTSNNNITGSDSNVNSSNNYYSNSANAHHKLPSAGSMACYSISSDNVFSVSHTPDERNIPTAIRASFASAVTATAATAAAAAVPATQHLTPSVSSFSPQQQQQHRHQLVLNAPYGHARISAHATAAAPSCSPAPPWSSSNSKASRRRCAQDRDACEQPDEDAMGALGTNAATEKNEPSRVYFDAFLARVSRVVHGRYPVSVMHKAFLCCVDLAQRGNSVSSAAGNESRLVVERDYGAAVASVEKMARTRRMYCNADVCSNASNNHDNNSSTNAGKSSYNQRPLARSYDNVATQQERHEQLAAILSISPLSQSFHLEQWLHSSANTADRKAASISSCGGEEEEKGQQGAARLNGNNSSDAVCTTTKTTPGTADTVFTTTTDTTSNNNSPGYSVTSCSSPIMLAKSTHTAPLQLCFSEGMCHQLGLRALTSAERRRTLAAADLLSEDGNAYGECHFGEFVRMVNFVVERSAAGSAVAGRDKDSSPVLSAHRNHDNRSSSSLMNTRNLWRDDSRNTRTQQMVQH